MIAAGPYRRSIPFATIQQIKIDVDTENHVLVTLSISNEVGRVKSSVNFSNYIFLTSRKGMIDTLSLNPDRLIEHIKANTSNTKNLHLFPQDFAPKAKLAIPTNASLYHNVYEETRRFGKSVKTLYALVASYRKNKGQYVIGNIVKETILLKGFSPTNSTLYTLSQTAAGYGVKGAVWPGSAHSNGEVIMAGNIHTETAHPNLSSESTLNAKTKDMRILKLAERFSLSSRPKRVPKNAYLSAATFSRNKAGNVHGLFSLDHLSFAQENADFGFLIKANSSLLSATGIKDIIVYQKVVKVDDAGNDLTPGYFAPAGLKQENLFRRVASLKRGLRIINRGNQSSILNISFVDRTAKEYSSNLLEYKVEVIFDDQTKEALLLVAKKLRDQLARYERRPSKLSIRPAKQLIDTYLASIGFILGSAAFARISSNAWQKYFLSLMSGVTPEDNDRRQRVLTMIQSFAASLKAILSPTKNITGDGADFNSKIYNVKKDSGLRLVKTFPQKYSVTDYKSVGLDYVDDIISNPRGAMPVISYAKMTARVDEEVKKYSVTNPNAGSINKVGFLTPRSVSLRANPLAVSTTSLDNSTGNFVALIRSKKDENPATSLETKKTSGTNMREILNQSGIAIAQNNSSLRKVVFDNNIVNPLAVDSENYFSSTSNFVIAETAADARVSGSSESIIKSSQLEDRSVQSLLVSELVSQTVTKFNNITRITNPSAIRGSLALRKTQEDSLLLKHSDSMTNIVNFGSLVQVQYLAAYNPLIGVKHQNWTLLNQQIYNRALENKEALICRLVKVSNTVDAPTILHLQPLASVFVLGPVRRNRAMGTYTALYQKMVGAFSKSNNSLNYLNSPDILYAKNIPFPTEEALRESAPAATRATRTRGPGTRRRNITRGAGY